MMPSVNSGYGNGTNQWMLIVKIPKGDGKYKNTGKQRIMQLSKKTHPKSKHQAFPKFERYSIQIRQCSTSIPYAFSPLSFHLFSSVCPRRLKDIFCFFGSLKYHFFPLPYTLNQKCPPPPPSHNLFSIFTYPDLQDFLAAYDMEMSSVPQNLSSPLDYKLIGVRMFL